MEAQNLLEKLDLTKLSSYLLTEDEVLDEGDMIQGQERDQDFAVQTQYARTVPNLMTGSDVDIGLLEGDLDLDLLGSEEIFNFELPNFGESKEELESGNTGGFLIFWVIMVLEKPKVTQKVTQKFTQKFTLPEEFNEEWEDIGDDEIFGDL